MTELADRIQQLSDEQRGSLLRRLRATREAGRRAEAARRAISPAQRQGDAVALSFTQERIWFLEQFAPGTAYHNMSGVARIPMRMDPAIFADCVDEVVQRHEILRTRFEMMDGEPAGVVVDDVTVPVRVLTELSADDRERLFLEDAREPFDLATAPLLRVTIVPTDTDCFVQLTMHHLVSDGFSTGVFFGELGALYRLRLAGMRTPLPPLPFQFADVAAWERGHASDRTNDGLLDHWARHLDGAPQRLTLAADHPRPARMTYRGSRLPLEIPGDLMDQVRAFSREQGVTPFVTTLAAFAVTLSRYAMQDDLVVGVPVANREQPGTEQIIGPFLNTLALRFDLGGGPTSAEFVQQVNGTVLGGFQHQAVPLERVLRAIQAKRDPSRSPLFQAVFNFQADRSAASGAPGAELRDLPNGGCQSDLLFNIVTTGEGATGHVDYYDEVYEEASVARLAESYVAVLRAVVSGAEQPVAELPLLPSEGVAALVQEASSTVRPYEQTCVHEIVLDRARAHPERVALAGGGRTMTYGELDARTAALAARLRSRVDAPPAAHVAVCLPRSMDTVVAILGVLRAGFAFIPLDPSYPRDRLAFICADAGIAGLVTQNDLRDVLPQIDVPTVYLDEPLPGPAEHDADRATAAGVDGRAYTIYTSGSTGKPKGVQVSHRNLVNFLDSMRDQPGLSEDDVLLAVTSPSFDIAMLEMLLPLVTGARTVVAAPADVVDGRRLAALLDQHEVTVMQATPTTWHLLVESGWAGRPGLRALCGGEAFPAALAGELLARCGEVWNMYGPTETTIWSTIHRVTDGDVRDGAIPIGRPIRNTTAFVVDQGRNPVPPGVPGELWLGGDGVAIGYHDRPELNASQFVEAPFLRGQRLYRTGDLVRARPGGTLDYAGRFDHQVKVRGFRIELGEIETVLGSHPGVARAVAVAMEDGAGQKSIIGYVEPAQATGEDLIAELRASLRERLPEYMVPARIVGVADLPLTPNGKIDRKSLPKPDEAAETDPEGPAGKRGHVDPRNETEQALAAIWQDLLGLPTVGVHDGFFEVGGHSLLATKLIFRVREVLGADLPLQALFEGEPTVAGMAALLTDEGARNGLAGDKKELDLAAEAQLADDIRPGPGAHVHSVSHPQNLLVTGATGFVGAFLLAELLKSTKATAFCLVRAASLAEGHERIQQALAEYGIWEEEFKERIIPVVGSLSRPRLGLSRPEWQHLAAMVDVVYHSGAEVNFLQPYHALKPANVLGTAEVLRLACDGAVKPVHFVSTTYVFSRFAYPAGTQFTEDMEPIHDLDYTFGYTQSKWVSEQMVLEAGRRGLPVYIYRAGRVAGHSETGACQTYDFVWQATKVGIEMGVAPVMDMTVDITPVDYVVGALVHLSRQPDLQGQAFHLVSQNPLPEPELVAWIENHGYGGERLTFGEWCHQVTRRAAELSDRTAGALAPFLSGALPLDQIPAARFDQRNVEQGLVGTRIACPPIDDRLLRLYFDYFTKIGYLPTPRDLAPQSPSNTQPQPQPVGEGAR